MYRRQFENTTFTRWCPELDIVKAAPAQGKHSPEGSTLPPGGRRRRRDSYEKLVITVQFRGGPEASWLVTARNRTWRFAGHLCLHDALAAVVF